MTFVTQTRFRVSAKCGCQKVSKAAVQKNPAAANARVIIKTRIEQEAQPLATH